MVKELKYNGYSASPSDYECLDGDLSAALGLIPEDGNIKPILPATNIIKDIGDGHITYVHKTSNFKHYIRTSGKDVYWLNHQAFGELTSYTGIRIFTADGANSIYKITAIGNTLVIICSDGMHYFLWKSKEGNYVDLGTEIPECTLSFGLQGEMVRGDAFSISFNSISAGDIYNEFSDNNKTTITEQVLAKVNKFISENSTHAGRFIFPFLVRYAYRLYDGSLTKHSAPILMICSSDLAPQVIWERITGRGSYTDAQLRIISMVHQLDYAAQDIDEINAIRDWSDIVKSIDVFLSKPIYTYDPNGECSRFSSTAENDCFCFCKHINQAASTDTYPLRYQHHKFSKLYAFTFDPTNLTSPNSRLLLPRRSEDDVKNDIKSCGQFYFLESIKLEDLSLDRALIPVENEYLQSLVAREVMTDDYDSHDKLIPETCFPYNSRLNIANIKKSLFKGYNPYAVFNYADGYVNKYGDVNDPLIADTNYSCAIFVFIKQDGRDIVVRSDYAQFPMREAPFYFFYYPNVNAYKAVIVEYMYFPFCYEIKLEPHDFLNGAFYFSGWSPVRSSNVSIPEISTTAERIVTLSNKLYTSAVNNPFYFPLEGIKTIGTGTILGISAAAKALSQGQFGQFPLYAFTDDGVWALEVSSDGFFKPSQPISRDVCVNADSITQIDSAVLFITDRGIMLISGSETMCISDVLDSPDVFSPIQLGRNWLTDLSGFTEEQMSFVTFREFLTKAKMLYDYNNQRIIVFNPERRYAYVYSLKDKKWGMMASYILSGCNSYPECLATIQGDGANALINLSEPDRAAAEQGINGLLITRPLKLDAPDILKTVDAVFQRGYFRTGHVRQVLYGSNDLFHWFPVWSSKSERMQGFAGTPYKYFRIVVMGKFDKNESIVGSSISYTPRQNNKLR